MEKKSLTALGISIVLMANVIAIRNYELGLAVGGLGVSLVLVETFN